MYQSNLLYMNRPKWHELFAIEATVCEKCGHSEGDHYWNGGGNPAQSGYDQCRKEGCKCIDYDQNKDFVTEIVGYDENAIKIINEAMAEQKRLILEEGDKMEQKPDNKYDDEQMLRYRQQWKSGYNQALTDYQERIKQLSEEVDHEWENEKVKRANMINL